MSQGLREILESEERIHSERHRVRFQDVDAAGVVFYARIFDLFHDAYVGFLRERGAPLDTALRDGSWAAPLSRAEAEYLRPLRFGDEVTVSIVHVDVAETEFAIGYRIDVGDEAACVGRTRHVAVDPTSFRRTAVPDGLRAALTGESAG